MFQDNMHNNSQVKTLSIGMAMIPEQLSSIFPDVTRVILGGYIGFIARADTYDKPLFNLFTGFDFSKNSCTKHDISQPP
jgi:hypothetical protein